MGRGWWEDLFYKVAKGRLKIGFRRPFGLVGKGCGLKRLRPLQNSPKSPKFPPRHLGDFS
ncbi:hypothetical protein FCG15_04495 [Neisseria meningitidis]|nr:hypothetical protein [Neisseria meningitidis]MBG8745074.1 hypothetical protein [Neisseria meningitidis]MBG8767612.1 hypothetical protein [Neisseria meningitidis]MBG8781412.1 hypothetical protein [Neisseria meningitidis]MBJ7817138.1 hypothetical protein [Neisseria meningitidis]